MMKREIGVQMKMGSILFSLFLLSSFLLQFPIVSSAGTPQCDQNVSPSQCMNNENNESLSFKQNLMKKCKSDREGLGCTLLEREQLKTYVFELCGEIPSNTHIINKRLFESYISDTKLNVAFVSGWSLLNPSSLEWPICVVCSFQYPRDPDWEANIDFCKE